MRSPGSLVLISILVGSAASATAQPFTSPGGRISRSAAHEAARSASLQQGDPVDPDWSRAIGLPPGTELVLSVAGSRRAGRFFIAGDASGLSVLNADEAVLPGAARDVLRDVAATHPEYFPDAQRGRRFELRKDVHLGPDGVSVAGRKVADLAQLLERYERHDVSEIDIARSQSSPVGCAIAGYIGGSLIGGLPGILLGSALGGDTGPALVGMTAGWALGSIHVYRRCRHKPERVIYSAADGLRLQR